MRTKNGQPFLLPHKHYNLSIKRRAAILAYLKGEIARTDAAKVCGIAQQNLSSITDSIFRELIAAGRIEIDALIKYY